MVYNCISSVSVNALAGLDSFPLLKILTISAVFGNLESSQFEEYFQIPLEVKIFLYLSFYMITHLLCNQMVDVHASN